MGKMLTLSTQGYRLILSILRMLRAAEKCRHAPLELESLTRLDTGLDTDNDINPPQTDHRMLHRRSSRAGLLMPCFSVHEDDTRLVTHIDIESHESLVL